ncbi:hypothetical protein E3P92_01249 [Wallemia ichthyophaga]|nr:hypothetical protein E3P92_01249 [Wallemia ichthyophaga]TIB36364.1 hypothetical protein E3P84_00999 [Wallemia ichthyophaga]TIB42782.1 hypothetical protein E3P83_01044 [Wallemia ichthyophaga]
MLNTELPAKVGDGIAYRHSCLSNTQAEQLDSLSKRLVQNNGMLLNDSPTFITPSAAQFDLIYDDLLDAVLTDDNVLNPPPMRAYSEDLPHSAITCKSQLSNNNDSLKSLHIKHRHREHWPPYSPKPTMLQSNEETGTNTNNTGNTNNAESDISITANTSPSPPPLTDINSHIAKKGLSQRLQSPRDDFRLYLKDNYLSAAKREYPMSDKLRQLQSLSEQAQCKIIKSERLSEQLQVQQQQKDKEREKEKGHRAPLIFTKAQASRKASHASAARLRSHKSLMQKTQPKVKEEVAYVSDEDEIKSEKENIRPTDTRVHFKPEEVYRQASDLHHKTSSSTVSTEISTLITPPSNQVVFPNHIPPQSLSLRYEEDGVRKSVRTRIAKGLRINPSITR